LRLDDSPFDALADAVLLFDETSHIRFVNRAAGRLFGIARDDFVGRDVRTLLPEPTRWVAGETRDASARRASGVRFPVRLSIGELTSDDGPLHLVSVHDLSERERLEADRNQTTRMDALGRFSGGIAHGFNNLLTVISGYSQLLLNGLDSGDPLRGLCVEIERTVERASDLTHQLLLFSRKQSGQPTSIDLNTILGGMERMLQRLVGNDVRLQFRLGTPLGRTLFDPGQLEQVISNLCEYARDSMLRSGRLEIETANVDLGADPNQRGVRIPPGRYIQLTIIDSGVGVVADAVPHLFEPFFLTKEPGKGNGLGLAMVYSIVKQWSGYIDVQSELGRGTRFRILLPREPDGARPTPTTVVVEPPGGKETILIAEDDASLLILIGRILTRLGYRVLQAASGREAMRLMEEEKGPIDLLVSDVVMPEMSGAELAEHLLKKIPSLRVLLISGYTGETVLNRGVVAGGLGFLAKPFTATVLAHKIRELLDVHVSPGSGI
jgi:PAS domain S-box-containing protein